MLYLFTKINKLTFFKVNIIFYCKLILSAFKWGIAFLSCVHNVGGRIKNCKYGQIVPYFTVVEIGQIPIIEQKPPKESQIEILRN